MNYNANAGRIPSQKTGHRKQKYVTDPSTSNLYPPIYNPYNQPMPGPNMYDGMQNPSAPYPPQQQATQGFNHGGYGYDTQPPPPYDQNFSIPSQLMANPMVTGMAMQYGQALMGSGKQFMNKELQKYDIVSRLKYYFAVDTSYVRRKLALLFFPFTHSDWSVKYDQDQPVQPRFAINAPDLYIPTMAYLTYVLISGLVLGMQNRFTPEILGIQASSALAWMVFEILVELVVLYLMNIQTSLRTLDLVAFSGYKYVGIIFAVFVSLAFQKLGYYIALFYFSVTLIIFLLRTLKIRLLPGGGARRDPYSEGGGTVGTNRGKLYLLFVAGIQPLLMWWLSAHIVIAPVPKT